MQDIGGFIERWTNKGDEKSDTQKFWLELLHDLFAIDNPGSIIDFEKRVELSHVSFIDAYIPSTGTIIEQKSRTINTDTPAKQSDGTTATPFEQAKRYRDWLPASQQGRYIVVCNFQEFRIHDMENPKAPPEVILLQNLRREWHKLTCLIDTESSAPKEIREAAISITAGDLVGKLYDSLLERYINPDDKDSQRCLNVFCVRLVFLLYSEDAGLFRKSQFHDYLKPRELTARTALRDLFTVLSQKPEDRDPYLEADLKAFPYVNGGLFEDSNIELPQLDGEPLRIILEDMSEGFDWSGISPTIFGAVFESTLNPETRHTGGMHYTSIENIHKAIDPLFMDELNEEFASIMKSPKKDRTKKLRTFQKKLASMTFFDPACGSGNFLTESYLSIRRLENRILAELSKQISFTASQDETPIQVSIAQFCGIEINDFAVAVARTALWIAEAQMWNETKSIVHFYGELFPLKSYSTIREANALRTDWHDIVTPKDMLFIMGNPPFLGYSIQNKAQKQDMLDVFLNEKGKPYSTVGKTDYVAGWYYKASKFIQGTRARAAFVSTNSITQGEQVSAVFKHLREMFRIHIDFAHTPFKWDSEASEKAQVHVVIIGINAIEEEEGPQRLKRHYTSAGLKLVGHINYYLAAAPDVFAEPRTYPIFETARRMWGGNRPADGGNLLLSAEEYAELITKEPGAKKWIKRYMMGDEFINNIERYCLWLEGISPKELRSLPLLFEKVKKCKQFRLKSTKAATRKFADTPTLFMEIRRSGEHYLAIPVVSSEKRSYIPMGWLDDSVIPGNKLQIIPDADLYDFGILTSRVHMAWMRRVCGRLEMRYSYSIRIVYNNFVWPSVSEDMRRRIEGCAQRILDARAAHPECSFADLYDDDAMPPDLRGAHRENDAVVCRAYGYDEEIGEEDIVGDLFRRYYALKGEDVVK